MKICKTANIVILVLTVMIGVVSCTNPTISETRTVIDPWVLSEPADLFFIAGQSNAVGIGTYVDGRGSNINMRAVRTNGNTDDSMWFRFMPGQNHSFGCVPQRTDIAGIEIRLSELVQNPSVLVKSAYGATSMFDRWNLVYGDLGFYSFERLARAINDLDPVGITHGYIIWMQGESDAVNANTSYYEPCLNQLLNAYESAFDAKGITHTTFIVETKTNSSSVPYTSQIVTAQMAVADAPNRVFIPTSGLALKTDGVHLTMASLHTVAEHIFSYVTSD